MRLILDTNVWLDLLWFRDPRAAHVLDALQCGAAHAVIRADCRDEWVRVLDYPALAISAGARVQLVSRFDSLALLLDPETLAASAALRLDSTSPALPRCRDSDDQKFLELARDANANVVLSRDGELLRLSARMVRAGECPILAPSAWRLPVTA